MSDFFMGTTPSVKLTGYQKIAILLGEIGEGAGDAVLDKLNLSTDQVKQIRKAMKQIRNVGREAYNPWDSEQVNRELAVLEEFKRYGELRGIYKEVPHVGLIKTGENSAQENVRNLAAANPEALAKVLGQWLNSDK